METWLNFHILILKSAPAVLLLQGFLFFILTIRFTVWVVWPNTWRLHLPRRQIQSLKNRKGEGGAGGNCSIGPALLNLKSSGHRKNKHWPCQVKIVLGTSDSSNKGLEPWGSRRRAKVHTFSNSFPLNFQIQSVANMQNRWRRATREGQNTQQTEVLKHPFVFKFWR